MATLIALYFLQEECARGRAISHDTQHQASSPSEACVANMMADLGSCGPASQVDIAATKSSLHECEASLLEVGASTSYGCDYVALLIICRVIILQFSHTFTLDTCPADGANTSTNESQCTRVRRARCR
jgi:hypothetical protein